MVSTHDCDASGLEELAAERDRARAELERLRREKREVEIELAILVRTVGAGHGVPVGRLLARVGLARSTYYHQLNAMNRPDRDEGCSPWCATCPRTACAAMGTDGCGSD